ncbi:hypothetical protein R3I93_010736 [Phoxinus phoxinus]|uniref:Uncharacterized protein n=1 Tax=Phoxinus phoxinus TaxID=58324 RepID=A0AAN9CYA4_9TELE
MRVTARGRQQGSLASPGEPPHLFVNIAGYCISLLFSQLSAHSLIVREKKATSSGLTFFPRLRSKDPTVSSFLQRNIYLSSGEDPSSLTTPTV